MTSISESEMQLSPSLNLVHYSVVDQIMPPTTLPSLVNQIPSNPHLLPPLQQLPPTNLIHTQLISNPQLVLSTPALTTALIPTSNQLFEFSHPPPLVSSTNIPGPSLGLSNGIMSVCATTRAEGSHNGSEYRVSLILQYQYTQLI